MDRSDEELISEAGYQEYTILRGEDGDYYVAPVELRKDFDKLLIAIGDGRATPKQIADFARCKYISGPDAVTFTKWK